MTFLFVDSLQPFNCPAGPGSCEPAFTWEHVFADMEATSSPSDEAPSPATHVSHTNAVRTALAWQSRLHRSLFFQPFSLETKIPILFFFFLNPVVYWHSSSRPVVLKLQSAPESLRGCFKTQIARCHLQSFWFRRCGMGWKICTFNNYWGVKGAVLMLVVRAPGFEDQFTGRFKPRCTSGSPRISPPPPFSEQAFAQLSTSVWKPCSSMMLAVFYDYFDQWTLTNTDKILSLHISIASVWWI